MSDTTYKGPDLDLKALVGDDSEAGLWTRTRIFEGGRADPILVDPAVLTVMNHAYDLALAHRAREVQLEHVLNALTLNVPATQTLEAHGIVVASLRRESASAIANIPPADDSATPARPATAKVLEDLLRQSADLAYRAQKPVSVDLLLGVLRETEQKVSGIGLLRRHSGLTAGKSQATPTPVRIAHVASQRAPSDTAQSARLDALERMVQSLSQELSEERQAYSALRAEIDRGPALAGLRRHALSPRRTSDSDAQSTIAQQLQLIEQGIETKFSDLAEGWLELGDRIAQFETKFEKRQSELAGIGEDGQNVAIELAKIEESLAAVSQRIAGLENGRPASGADLSPITEILAKLETKTENALSGTRAMMERIAALEGKIDELAEHSTPEISDAQVERVSHALDGEFGTLRTALTAVEATGRTQAERLDDGLGDVQSRITKLDEGQQALSTALQQWRSNQTGDLCVITNVVEKVEAETNAVKNTVDVLSNQLARIHTILAARELKKSKFRNWLYGTDDWYTASWNTKLWREQMIASGGTAPMPRRDPGESSA